MIGLISYHRLTIRQTKKSDTRCTYQEYWNFDLLFGLWLTTSDFLEHARRKNKHKIFLIILSNYENWIYFNEFYEWCVDNPLEGFWLGSLLNWLIVLFTRFRPNWRPQGFFRTGTSTAFIWGWSFLRQGVQAKSGRSYLQFLPGEVIRWESLKSSSIQFI